MSEQKLTRKILIDFLKRMPEQLGCNSHDIDRALWENGKEKGCHNIHLHISVMNFLDTLSEAFFVPYPLFASFDKYHYGLGDLSINLEWRSGSVDFDANLEIYLDGTCEYHLTDTENKIFLAGEVPFVEIWGGDNEEL